MPLHVPLHGEAARWGGPDALAGSGLPHHQVPTFVPSSHSNSPSQPTGRCI